MTQFFIENGDIIIKLLLSISLGISIGLERFFVHKEAGMKTHAMVTLGATLFIIISETLAAKYGNITSFDHTRMASQVIIGIGFLGAGSIILQGSRLSGLTTASGLWVTAGIGVAVGFGFYDLAIITTILVLLIFIMLFILEQPLKRAFHHKENIQKEK